MLHLRRKMGSVLLLCLGAGDVCKQESCSNSLALSRDMSGKSSLLIERVCPRVLCGGLFGLFEVDYCVSSEVSSRRTGSSTGSRWPRVLEFAGDNGDIAAFGMEFLGVLDLPDRLFRGMASSLACHSHTSFPARRPGR